jgi:hypothetical protein
MIALIGGIMVDGNLRRDVELKPLTGSAELVLAELHQSDMPHPDKVSQFLDQTVATIGGAPVASSTLSVGDRQHLVRQIGVQLGVDLVWLKGDCTKCGEELEIPVRQAELPTKAAGAGFPSMNIEVAGMTVSIRAPTGDDQAAIADHDHKSAAMTLLDRLVARPEGPDWTDAQQQTLEQAIEDLSPEVAQEVAATCPECDADLRIEVDPYLTLTQLGVDILDEIHVLASHYHWAEGDIVALPKARRQTYLTLIDRDRGMQRHVDPDTVY